MQTVTTIGLDIAKSVFHRSDGVDAGGQVVIRRQLKRRHVLAFFQKLLPCLVGIEACASSHHWYNLGATGQERTFRPLSAVELFNIRKNFRCIINARVESQSLPLPRDISAKCGGWRHEKRFKISCLREPY